MEKREIFYIIIKQIKQYKIFNNIIKKFYNKKYLEILYFYKLKVNN